MVPFQAPRDTSVERLQKQSVQVQFLDEQHAVHAAPAKPMIQAVVRVAEAYATWSKDRVANYAGGYQGKERLKKQIEQFDVVDCELNDFGFGRIKAVVDHWRGRPKTAHGERCSKSYAENQLGEFRRFLLWTSAAYPDWQLPNLDAVNWSVPRIASDATSNAVEDKFWTRDELTEVYRTAQPLTQLIIGLGLNTCSGPAELGRIRVDDFLFDQQHPKAKLVGFDATASWMIGTRRKTHTHSEALLWDWVAELVKRQIEICEANRWPYLFTDNGEPMYRDNDIYAEVKLPLPNTTKPESRFGRRYNNAVDLAYRQKRIDRKLSVAKLRKSFANYLTQNAHSDLGTLALSHQTSDDPLLKHYSNKPYGRLFRETMAAADDWDLTK